MSARQPKSGEDNQRLKRVLLWIILLLLILAPPVILMLLFTSV